MSQPGADQVQSQPGNPTPAGSGDGQGNLTPQDWRASLPEDLRNDPSLQSFKDVAGLAKSYREAQKMIGGSLRIPGPNATPEEIAAFRAKLGVPDSPDGYQIEVDESIKPILNEKLMASFKNAAHRLGVPAQAVQGLWQWYAGELQAMQRSIAQVTKQVEAQLKQEWGDALYERNIALAQRTVREFGGEELVEFLDASGLGNHPGLIKMLAKIGHMLAEDGHVAGDVEGLVTADEARRKIAEVMANPDHPYHAKNAMKPGHAEAVAEVSRLFQIAYPSA